MEMKVTETPARRAEEGCPRRDSAYDRREEATDHQDEALEKHPHETRFPTLDWVVRLERDREHYHESDDKHVRHAHAGGQRADIAAAGLKRQPIGKEGVVHRGEAHHQPQRGQDAAEDKRVRHLQDKTQQTGEHQHVDENVGAESEKRVPVAGCPQSRTLHLGCGRRHHLLLSIRNAISIAGRALARRQPAKEKPDVPISEPRRFVDDSSLETSGFMRMLRT